MRCLFLFLCVSISSVLLSQKGLVIRCESQTMENILVNTLAVLDTLQGDTVSVYLHDKSGKRVATLIENEVIEGHERFPFKAKHIPDDYYYGIVKTEKGSSTFGLLKNSNHKEEVSVVNENMVELFPNPTTNSVKLKTTIQTIEYLFVYDLQGKKLFDKRFVENMDEFDLSTFQKGTYLFMFIHKGETILKKVIKS